ncbi:maleylacetoacetate isomerase [Salipiger sp. IMCC34102]|uniref:maleylacetoacetate isomerase n=1 Tax=Salipiger sp. IMCC34102 TaxID=2510647 RepID=UPI00101C9B69|nr:maleylacetoacetate isomerase [Salipiger sp. IMCC34102]RYH02842.1 maleylacetoacetate isomerase [Salipiger sp. IMCC34102]
MPVEITLYDYWRSTASYRVRIALNLAGLAYRAVPVDLVAGDQRSEAHRARNPQGLVPVLDIDGSRLTQSMAILDYLEDTGRLSLRPDDPAEAASIRAICQAMAADIHPVCNLRVVNRVAELTGDPEARAPWMRHWIRPGLEAVEAQLHPTGPYACGAALSQADLVLIPQLYNADRWEVETADLPRITRASRACADHPAFAAAHPDRVKG